MTFLRWIAAVMLLVPMTIGFLVACIVHPFVFGYGAGVEKIDEFARDPRIKPGAE